jgi:hypothetical protein
MQQGRFRATGMMIHHPYALRRSSVATSITEQVGHFWKADPGQSPKAPKRRRVLKAMLKWGCQHLPSRQRRPVQSILICQGEHRSVLSMVQTLLCFA